MGKIATDTTLQELLTLLRSHLNTQQNKLIAAINEAFTKANTASSDTGK